MAAARDMIVAPSHSLAELESADAMNCGVSSILKALKLVQMALVKAKLQREHAQAQNVKLRRGDIEFKEHRAHSDKI